jgi:acylphosphatase
MRRAAALGLGGWVRNRRDGSVEALFIGPSARVDRMLADCRLGPSLARVESIDTQPAEAAGGGGFDVRPTA